MVKPNYAFEKRQRDLAKKQKKEEKRQKKIATQSEPSEDNKPTAPADDGATGD
jgi:hypothetical protein